MGTIPDPSILKNSIVSTLGIRLLPPESDGEVRAVMPCDARTCQPYGFLSGGAMLCLQETLAGYGSMLRLPDELKPVGASVMASHVAAKPKGGNVLGKARLVHEGRSTHLWTVDVVDMASGRLLSTARILNQIIPLNSRPGAADGGTRLC